MASLYELQQQGPQARTSNPAFEKADGITDGASKAYERIRSDATLSDEGKRQQMARVYQTTRQQMEAHQAAIETQKAAKVTQLSRAAFGVPKDPIEAMSYRNAQALAEQLPDAATAGNKLNRALIDGDPLMAQAIARHATDQMNLIPGLVDPAWASVLDSYVAATPAVGEALTELSQIQQQGSSFQHEFMQAGYFTVPKPAELDRMHDHQIEQMAVDSQPANG